uniref:Uncharacterized protein n=1 Tax=Marseillevirus LCMAC101 TaxID=2506602 RepID=A0A481YRP7_9VIRU|nr:MAG: hypothetical protein LCMAC101_01920 [Marseillevirus LCMAC101]
MESGTSYLSVPLVATPRYSVGPIIIAFVVIVVILGIIMYLFSNNPRYNDIRSKSIPVLVKIYNKTSLPYEINIPNVKDIVLEPGKDISLYIKSLGVIYARAHNYDGEEVDYKITISDDIDKIYITPDGLISSLGSLESTDLINNSFMDVIFIQKTKKGIRWEMHAVTAQSAVVDKVVGIGSTWEVAAAGDEDNPIDSITVAGRPSKIVFDGDKLKAY